MKTKKTQTSIKGELRMYDLRSILRGALDVIVTIMAITLIKVMSGVDSLDDLLSADYVAMLVGTSSMVLSKTARKLLSKTEYVE